MRADIVPGGIFPDYELTDHTKIRHKLSELQGIDPMILVLSRGHFCPKDHQQDLELAAFYPRIVAGYTRIVTISTDNILVSNDFRESVGAQWTFLSDAGRKVQKDLDIQEYTDPHNNPMIPHTLVLKPGLVSTVSTTAIGSGQTVDRGFAPRSARGHPRNPRGLGPDLTWAQRELRDGGPLHALRLH